MEKKIAVIGLGYVGLPLAVEFAKKYPTIGFDINTSRVNQLMSGHDHTLEVEDIDLQKVLVTDLLAAETKGKVCIAPPLLVILNLLIFTSLQYLRNRQE